VKEFSCWEMWPSNDLPFLYQFLISDSKLHRLLDRKPCAALQWTQLCAETTLIPRLHNRRGDHGWVDHFQAFLSAVPTAKRQEVKYGLEVYELLLLPEHLDQLQTVETRKGVLQEAHLLKVHAIIGLPPKYNMHMRLTTESVLTLR